MQLFRFSCFIKGLCECSDPKSKGIRGLCKLKMKLGLGILALKNNCWGAYEISLKFVI